MRSKLNKFEHVIVWKGTGLQPSTEKGQGWGQYSSTGEGLEPWTSYPEIGEEIQQSIHILRPDSQSSALSRKRGKILVR